MADLGFDFMCHGPGADPAAHTGGFGCGVGFASPLTRMVATPCYRAPEVPPPRQAIRAALCSR